MIILDNITYNNSIEPVKQLTTTTQSFNVGIGFGVMCVTLIIVSMIAVSILLESVYLADLIRKKKTNKKVDNK